VTLVVGGATIACTFGVAPASLIPTPGTVTASEMPAANLRHVHESLQPRSCRGHVSCHGRADSDAVHSRHRRALVAWIGNGHYWGDTGSYR
jgi:hypothetical protein